MDGAMMNERKAYYDNLKFGLIALVVIGHGINFVDYETNKALMTAIYMFHMPLFVFISGFFFDETKSVTEKVIGYIALGFASKFLLFLVKAILFQDYTLSLWIEMYHPWYMFAMAFFMEICYRARNISKKYFLVASIVFATFAGFDSSLTNFMLVRMIAIFPFFILGNMARNINLELYIKKKYGKWNICGGMVIVGWFLTCIFFKEIISSEWGQVANFINSYAYMHRYDVIIRLMWYPVALLLGVSFMCIIPSKKIAFISEWGKRTVGVYFWHYPILFMIKYFCKMDFFASRKGFFTWLFVNILLTVILSLKPFEYIPDYILRVKKSGRKSDCLLVEK